METIKEMQNEESLIRRIFFAIRKNIFLILAIIIITTSLGIGYSYVKKPNYTASIRVNFNVDDDKKTTATINEMRLYIDTIVDFCGQGVVVDRANAYYIDWVDNYQKDYYAQNKTIEDFFNDFSIARVLDGNNEVVSESEIFKKYKRPNSNEEGTLKDENFLSVGSISTKTAKSDKNATNWVYAVNYTDANKKDALEKVYILVLAYKHELYWDSELGDSGVERYFTGLDVNIDSLGVDGVSSDVSKTKIAILGFVLGIVIASFIVYIKGIFDNTVKDKNELEQITGTQIIGCINYVEERDKNGK